MEVISLLRLAMWGFWVVCIYFCFQNLLKRQKLNEGSVQGQMKTEQAACPALSPSI